MGADRSHHGETSVSKDQHSATSREERFEPAFKPPLRLCEYEGLMVIEDSNGDELCRWGHASDWQKKVASQFVDSINAGGVWVAEGRVNVRQPYVAPSETASRNHEWLRLYPETERCDRCRREVVKNAAAQDAPYRKAGDRIAEVDETRQGVEKGRPLSDERKPGPTQLSGDSASDAVTAAVCDERKTSPSTTPVAAASIVTETRALYDIEAADRAFEKWWSDHEYDTLGFATSKGVSRSAWHSALEYTHG